MRWLTIRRIYQVFFFALFCALLYLASFGEIRRFPVSLLLEADPLIALASALASHVVFAGLALALVVVLITLVFGRVFCSWACPLGILNHAVSALPSLLKRRQKMVKNEWRPLQQTKYYLLLTLLVLAALGSLQVGLLDPIALTVRAFAVTIFPGLQLAGLPVYAEQPSYLGGWLIGALFLLILAANRWSMRFWCRVLCPLGGLLGAIAKFSLFRIHRSTDQCLDCHKCNENCHGACDPFGQIRVSDCVMCLNCLYACPQAGITYRFLPPTENETPAPDLQRRKTITALASGAVLFPVLRTSHGVTGGARHDAIRPPGALAEVDFAKKCVKCGACIRVCPTGVLQPAALETGFEGLWTPILRYDLGFCSHNCTLCSQVCPTGAIRPLTPAQRAGQAPIGAREKDQGDAGDQAAKDGGPQAAKDGGPRAPQPIKLGTAFYDRGRCLPWAMATPCIVCEEVCPVSPKAVWLEQGEVLGRDGRRVKVQLPHLDPALCIGCGTCQFRCPVGAEAAIRVSSVGETRSANNQLLLRSG